MTSSPRTALTLAQRVSARLGYTLVPTAELSRLPQATYLRRVFREWRISGVIDVGANEGQYHGFVRGEIRFDGPVVSVEPIPALVQQLTNRARSEPAWRVEGIALGAAPGSSSFLVTAGSQFSSFLEPLESTKGQFYGQTAIEESITVTVDTLDALIDRHSDFLGNRIYLKMDTQGYDLEALKGLSRHADRILALQSEASVKPIYKSMPHYTETIRACEAMGFTISQFFPNNDANFPLLIEFDCHFVRLPAR
jgi:FkbM family methyltransferase